MARFGETVSLPAARGRVGAALRDLGGLLLPVECAGCGVWDVELCESCAALLQAPIRRSESGAPALASAWAGSSSALPVWSVGTYEGALRGTVLAWKSGAGRRRLDRSVRMAGRAAGESWGRALLIDRPPVPGDAVVVPAPSGWQRRARGRLVVRDLALEVAAGLAEAGLAESGRGVVVDALRRRAGRAHQSGLGAAGRSVNRRHSMRLVRPLPPASACLLVDDVLTTGATLEECRRALAEAGHEVLAALVLAVIPGRPAGR